MQTVNMEDRAKSKAKKEISLLISKYEGLPKKRLESINEFDTRRMFIMPLFKSLGWDVDNIKTNNEVVEEEVSITGGRYDYSFRLNNVTQFILEAKSIPENLDKEKWAKQAVEYGWNKGIPWVVLTDFEGLKVFNSEWDTKHPTPSLEFNYKEYLERFDRMWLLSKFSFEKRRLNKLLSEFGITAKRVSVNETLSNDLVRWRDLLTDNLLQWNRNLDNSKIAEGVQRILDRLIFIRVVEDRGIEEKILWQEYRKWEKGGREPTNFIELLEPIFRRFDKEYDSNLFQEHFSEDLNTEGDPFATIIPELYTDRATGVRYRFDAIDADVLGSVYEQYLGHLQSSTTTTSSRKKQGIYYTPPHVVDYIVQNTLGKRLADISNSKYKDIAVLDPACGSGSFLTKAFDYLSKESKPENSEETHAEAADRKSKILKNNIYGVDLDSQAIEIARLNLMLEALEPKHKLPILTNNIKVGNSLIENQRITNKAFRWQSEFKKVFENGGFDVVIGNPPYLKEMDNKEVFEPIKKSKYKKYYQGKMDLWYFFLHKAMDVTKENGYIGFITNSYFMKGAGASKLIERINDELVMLKSVDFGDIKIFGDVSGRHMIHIYQKRKSRSGDKTIYIKAKSEATIDESNKTILDYEDVIRNKKIYLTKKSQLNTKNTFSLGNYFKVSQGVVEATDKVSKKALANTDKKGGIEVGDGVFVLSKDEIQDLKLTKKEKSLIKKYLDTNDVGRYIIDFNEQYLIYSDKVAKEGIAKGEYPNIKAHLDRMSTFITSSNKPYGLHRPRKREYFEEPKLICKSMFSKPDFTYDEEAYFVGFSFSVILQKSEDYSLKYLLGILNSDLARYWFNINGKKRGVGVDVGVGVFRKFPVYKANKSSQKKIAFEVNELLQLGKKLGDSEPKSDEWHKIKKNMSSLEDNLNQQVLKLYDMKPEQIKISD